MAKKAPTKEPLNPDKKQIPLRMDMDLYKQLNEVRHEMRFSTMNEFLIHALRTFLEMHREEQR